MEHYLLDQLDEADRDAFEVHYFECPRCYSELQALRAVRDALAGERQQQRGAGRWLWLGAAAALVLTLSGIFAWQMLRSNEAARPAVRAGTSAPGELPSTNAREIARLAAVTPPAYEPNRFRSGGDREAFASGMARYVAGDFSGAIPLLRTALRQAPGAQDVRFYLGASHLLHGEPRDAVSVLQPLANSPQSPYAEEAGFLTAKAHLQSGDLEAAVADLDQTVAAHGEREQEAIALRARLAELRTRDR